MGISVRIKDVFFADELARARTLSARAFAPELAAIGRFFRDSIREGFVTETDPYGTPWKPLAKSTIKSKRVRGISDPAGILKETGELSKSFQYRVLVNGVRIFSNRTFEDGTTAEIHQEGGIHPIGKNAIPARPMVPDMDNLPPDWQEEVDRQIGSGLDRLFS